MSSHQGRPGTRPKGGEAADALRREQSLPWMVSHSMRVGNFSEVRRLLVAAFAHTAASLAPSAHEQNLCVCKQAQPSICKPCHRPYAMLVVRKGIRVQGAQGLMSTRRRRCAGRRPVRLAPARRDAAFAAVAEGHAQSRGCLRGWRPRRSAPACCRGAACQARTLEPDR